ncbi:hypothetical protein BDL97_02G031300 [Sphagnum fallax]|nr:hypothetical protein BDL97_02G031300 [Sphagnum fallax]
MGGRRFVHICGHRHFTLNVSFWTKDPPRRCADILCIFAYNHCSLPLPLTTTYYLRQNCRSSPPHLYSSVIAQILLDCPDEDLQSASCFATLALAQAVNSSASAGLKSTPTPSNPSDPLSNITVAVISLSLSNASIVGTLPPAIGNLTNLLELTLTNNPGLSGTIPKELTNITSLTILNLSNNNFSGSIPEELFMNKDPSLQQL